MPPMSMMIKPVSGSCNMRCHYCFYSDVANHREMRNYGKMDSDTMRTLIRKAFIYAEGNVSFAFQGGEPTLAGIDFFREFVRNVSQCNTRHIPVSFAVQTNGYDLSDELCQFFADHHFLAGVSVDGAKEIHNALRPDSAGAGSYDQVMTGIEKLKHHGVEYNILCVVTAPIAAQGKRVWQELKRHQYLQFIPCIDEFGGMLHDYSLTPEAYGQFLIDTFSCYAEDYASGHPVSERRFDNYLSILLGQQPELCGMRGMCGLYFLAEADGSIYPCDFYVLDEWKLGNVKSDSFFKMEKSAASRKFRSISLQLPDTCKKCIWLNLCHGGCRRDREPIINSHGSENKFCKSYYMFFEACLPQMQKMAERISHHLK